MAVAAKNIYYLRKQKRYTLIEALRLLPLIRKITAKAYTEAQPMLNLLQTHLSTAEHIDLTQKVQLILDAWSEEIIRLGAVPKGLWLVDFDNGQNFFCWKHGEETIGFCHGYQEGYSNRTVISVLDPTLPGG